MCARFIVLSDTPIAAAIAGWAIPLSRNNTIWMRWRCAGPKLAAERLVELEQALDARAQFRRRLLAVRNEDVATLILTPSFFGRTVPLIFTVPRRGCGRVHSKPGVAAVAGEPNLPHRYCARFTFITRGERLQRGSSVI
jgi:hypothetical protein